MNPESVKNSDNADGRPKLAAGLILGTIGLIMINDFFVSREDRLTGDYVILGPFILAAAIMLIVSATILRRPNDRAERIRLGKWFLLIGIPLILFPPVAAVGGPFWFLGAAFVCWIPGLALTLSGALLAATAKWKK